MPPIDPAVSSGVQSAIQYQGANQTAAGGAAPPSGALMDGGTKGVESPIFNNTALGKSLDQMIDSANAGILSQMKACKVTEGMSLEGLKAPNTINAGGIGSQLHTKAGWTPS